MRLATRSLMVRRKPCACDYPRAFSEPLVWSGISAGLADGKAWIATGAARQGGTPGHHDGALHSVLPLGGEAGTMMAKQIISFYIGGMGDYYMEP